MIGAVSNLPKEYLITKKNKNLWSRVLIVSLLAIFIQTSITTDTANPEPTIVVEPRPVLEQVSAKEVARELLDPKQFLCLTRLIGKESAWNPKAENPTSTASGIGQLLDSTASSLGMKKSDSAVSQLVATLSYISRRHSHPCGAWKHFQQKGFY